MNDNLSAMSTFLFILTCVNTIFLIATFALQLKIIKILTSSTENLSTKLETPEPVDTRPPGVRRTKEVETPKHRLDPYS